MVSPTSTVRLIVVGGDFELPEVGINGSLTFGRGRDVDIRVNHPLVSRRHCQLECRDGVVFVRDLGSLNGTFVGNRRVEEEIVLPPDGLLTMGTVTFRAIYPDGPVASEAPDDPRRTVGPAESPDRAAEDTVPSPGDTNSGQSSGQATV